MLWARTLNVFITTNKALCVCAYMWTSLTAHIKKLDGGKFHFYWYWDYFSSTALRHQMPIGVRKWVCVYESQNPFSPDKTQSLISPYSGSLQTEKVAERTFIRVYVKIQRHRRLLTLALGYTIMCIFFYVFPVHIHVTSGRVVN